MKTYEEVVFKMGGLNKKLVISRSQCAVAASKFKSHRLFLDLEPGSKPIASKSRRYNESDKLFIRNEVRKLLNEGIIEPSFLPWRAQVLVTKDERHKKRMVIDYSQTINRYTFLQ